MYQQRDLPGASDAEGATESFARVKRRLRAELGEEVFTSWFGRLEFDMMAADTAHLTVPTRFLKSWIEANYADRVLAVYRAEMPSLKGIAIGVRSSLGREAGTPVRRLSEAPRAAAPAARASVFSGDIKAPPSQDERTESGDIAGAPLDPRLTFESFIIGRSNALAHAAADRVARHQTGQALYNPLYLHAGVGLGKTHLLHAIGHEARSQGRRVIYLTADRFMYGFVASLKAQTSLAFKERLRGIDLLILDDVQFIQGKQIQQEFGHTINALIDAGRQIVVAIVAACLPAIAVGLTFEDVIKDRLFGAWPIVVAWFAGGVAILTLGRRAQLGAGGAPLAALTWRGGLVIGGAQILALWPGVSRSLVTILSATLVGLAVPAAVEFSFLLGFVILGGATAYETLSSGDDMVSAYGLAVPLLGAAVALVSAAGAMHWMVGYLNRRGLAIFGWYRVAVAGAAATLLVTGVISSS